MTGYQAIGHVARPMMRLQKGHVVPLHAHERADHIMVVFQGAIRLGHDGETIELHAPASCNVARGVAHQVEVLEDDTLVVCMFAAGIDYRDTF